MCLFLNSVHQYTLRLVTTKKIAMNKDWLSPNLITLSGIVGDNLRL